jgi:HKD family nuclease
LERLRKKIEKDKIFTYIITREPKENYHKEAVNIFMDSEFVEVRYNNSLHVKLYICALDEPIFGILGSGNLTRTSIGKNIEIGIMIFHQGKGRQILHELYHWGSVRLRTLKESKIVKKITYERR